MFFETMLDSSEVFWDASVELSLKDVFKSFLLYREYGLLLAC